MKYKTLFLPHLSLLFLLFFKSSIAADSLAPDQILPDNGTTLVSPNGDFELGFFGPNNSSNRYIGIWFKKVPIQTVVWVANKNLPIANSSGVLSVTPSGNIVISAGQSTIWSSNSTSRAPVLLRLLGNGNLVLDGGAWQSFDDPSDTLIPGMRLGWDLRTNQERYLTSWKSADDPSPGEFTYRMNPKGLPSIVLRKGPNITFRSGTWDGVRFGGAPVLQGNAVFIPIFVFNSTDVYYAFENTDASVISRFVVTESGQLTHFRWSEASGQWIGISTMQTDTCDVYAECGNGGVCEFGRSPLCACLKGFTPRLTEEWAQFDWMGGCVRSVPLNCNTSAGFRKFSRIKAPDTSKSVIEENATSREECEAACMRDCSCVAYAKAAATGCVLWIGGLVDMRSYASGGQELFVKMPLSELDDAMSSKKVAAIASVMVAAFLLLVALITWLVIRKSTARKKAGVYI